MVGIEALNSEALPMNLVLTKASDFSAPAAGSSPSLYDLGLGAATGNVLNAAIVRPESMDSLRRTLSGRDGSLLEFTYLLAGWVDIRANDIVRLKAGDVCCQIGLSDAAVAISDDLALFHLAAPDSEGARAFLAQRPQEFIAFDAPEAHVLGTGPRSFFDYRDLGLAQVTGGRMEIQVIRAQRPREGGTGWHWHTMSQLSLGLGGWAKLGVEGASSVFTQTAGDALCIPDRVIHNAGAFSRDYSALQLQIPAVYDTVPAAAPAAFAKN